MTTSSFAALRDLLGYARPYRKRLIKSSIYSVVNKLFDVMPEILIGVAIDVVVRQQDSFVATLGIVEPLHQLMALGALTFVIWAGESLFEYLHLIGWRELAQDLQHGLRTDTYEHVQRLDMAYFEDASTGNLVSILNDDVNQLEQFFNGGANTLLQVATTIVAVGGVFFAISPIVATLAFTPIPVIVIGAFYFQRRAQPLYTQVRDKVGRLSNRLAANIAGIATIKSFVSEAQEARRIRAASDDYVAANRAAIAVSSAFIPLIRMAILAGFMATLLLGGWLTLQGKLAVGAFGILVFLTQRLLWPLTDLAHTVDLYERAMAASRRILELLNAPVLIDDDAATVALNKAKGGVEFRDVSFAYATGDTVLHDLNLRIEAGQTIGFVGPTGSGKSTIIKLLLRFYEPTSGHVTLDGQNLTDYRVEDLRRQIGLVSQDVFLFQGSVAQNIAYGQDDINLASVRAAADAAEATEFVERLSGGFDALVGERGQKLSGGQRQRLSIARALLKDPPILILDEATSAVDSETEAAIARSILRIEEGRTTLIVAHRLSTVVHADNIVVIDRGRLVEQGTHEQLLAHNGLYASLWQVQTGSAASN
ncbi:MAG: ABC transporter ATP-binding protein [Gammaproteobacteria bacterium]